MILNSGGAGDNDGFHGQEGTITGKACPKGLYGIFCEVCSTGFLFIHLFLPRILDMCIYLSLSVVNKKYGETSELRFEKMFFRFAPLYVYF